MNAQLPLGIGLGGFPYGSTQIGESFRGYSNDNTQNVANITHNVTNTNQNNRNKTDNNHQNLNTNNNAHLPENIFHDKSSPHSLIGMDSGNYGQDIGNILHITQDEINSNHSSQKINPQNGQNAQNGQNIPNSPPNTLSNTSPLLAPKPTSTPSVINVPLASTPNTTNLLSTLTTTTPPNPFTTPSILSSTPPNPFKTITSTTHDDLFTQTFDLRHHNNNNHNHNNHNNDPTSSFRHQSIQEPALFDLPTFPTTNMFPLHPIISNHQIHLDSLGPPNNGNVSTVDINGANIALGRHIQHQTMATTTNTTTPPDSTLTTFSRSNSQFDHPYIPHGTAALSIHNGSTQGFVHGGVALTHISQSLDHNDGLTQYHHHHHHHSTSTIQNGLEQSNINSTLPPQQVGTHNISHLSNTLLPFATTPYHHNNNTNNNNNNNNDGNNIDQQMNSITQIQPMLSLDIMSEQEKDQLIMTLLREKDTLVRQLLRSQDNVTSLQLDLQQAQTRVQLYEKQYGKLADNYDNNDYDGDNDGENNDKYDDMRGKSSIPNRIIDSSSSSSVSNSKYAQPFTPSSHFDINSKLNKQHDKNNYPYNQPSKPFSPPNQYQSGKLSSNKTGYPTHPTHPTHTNTNNNIAFSPTNNNNNNLNPYHNNTSTANQLPPHQQPLNQYQPNNNNNNNNNNHNNNNNQSYHSGYSNINNYPSNINNRGGGGGGSTSSSSSSGVNLRDNNNSQNIQNNNFQQKNQKVQLNHQPPSHVDDVLEISLTEGELLGIIVFILHENPHVAIGKLGTAIHISGQDHRIPAYLKKKYGGLKKLLTLYPDLFAFRNDHPFNPTLELLKDVDNLPDYVVKYDPHKKKIPRTQAG